MPVTQETLNEARQRGMSDYQIIQHLRQRQDVDNLYRKWLGRGGLGATAMLDELVKIDAAAIQKALQKAKSIRERVAEVTPEIQVEVPVGEKRGWIEQWEETIRGQRKPGIEIKEPTTGKVKYRLGPGGTLMMRGVEGEEPTIVPSPGEMAAEYIATRPRFYAKEIFREREVPTGKGLLESVERWRRTGWQKYPIDVLEVGQDLSLLALGIGLPLKTPAAITAATKVGLSPKVATTVSNLSKAGSAFIRASDFVDPTNLAIQQMFRAYGVYAHPALKQFVASQTSIKPWASKLAHWKNVTGAQDGVRRIATLDLQYKLTAASGNQSAFDELVELLAVKRTQQLTPERLSKASPEANMLYKRTTDWLETDIANSLGLSTKAEDVATAELRAAEAAGDLAARREVSAELAQINQRQELADAELMLLSSLYGNVSTRKAAWKWMDKVTNQRQGGSWRMFKDKWNTQVVEAGNAMDEVLQDPAIIVQLKKAMGEGADEWFDDLVNTYKFQAQNNINKLGKAKEPNVEVINKWKNKLSVIENYEKQIKGKEAEIISAREAAGRPYEKPAPTTTAEEIMAGRRVEEMGPPEPKRVPVTEVPEEIMARREAVSEKVPEEFITREQTEQVLRKAEADIAMQLDTGQAFRKQAPPYEYRPPIKTTRDISLSMFDDLDKAMEQEIAAQRALDTATPNLIVERQQALRQAEQATDAARKSLRDRALLQRVDDQLQVAYRQRATTPEQIERINELEEILQRLRDITGEEIRRAPRQLEITPQPVTPARRVEAPVEAPRVLTSGRELTTEFVEEARWLTDPEYTASQRRTLTTDVQTARGDLQDAYQLLQEARPSQLSASRDFVRRMQEQLDFRQRALDEFNVKVDDVVELQRLYEETGRPVRREPGPLRPGAMPPTEIPPPTTPPPGIRRVPPTTPTPTRAAARMNVPTRRPREITAPPETIGEPVFEEPTITPPEARKVTAEGIEKGAKEITQPVATGELRMTQDGIPLVNESYFKSYPLASSKIKIVDIDDLDTAATQINVDRVLAEIRKDGLIPPIVDGFEVVDGNHRVAALKQVGITKIPVIDDADAWVQDPEIYGQWPWKVPEGEEAVVSPEATLLEKKLTGTGEAERIAAEVTPAVTELPKGIGRVRVDDLTLDPDRFQYKVLKGPAGVTGTLKQAQQFEEKLAGVVAVWKDPETGKTFVVNGHNRVELARRSGVDSINIQYLDVATAEEARVDGALINIAEGRGTAIDAAKLFRDNKITRADLEAKGIALTEKMASDGIALSNLHPSIFNPVTRGEFPLERAVVIGRKLTDQNQQLELVRLIEKQAKKGKTITNDVISELADMVTSAPTTQATEMTLFGPEVVEQTFALEKADVLSYVRSRLSREQKLFGVVSRARNVQELVDAGNVIDIQTNQNISKEAAQLLDIFDRVKHTKGDIAVSINDAAQRIGKGENASAVKESTYEKVRDQLSTFIERGERPGVAGVQGVPEAQLSIDVTRPEKVEAPSVIEPGAEVTAKAAAKKTPLDRAIRQLQQAKTLSELEDIAGTQGDLYVKLKRAQAAKYDRAYNALAEKYGGEKISSGYAVEPEDMVEKPPVGKYRFKEDEEIARIAEAEIERLKQTVDRTPDNPTTAQVQTLDTQQSKTIVADFATRLPETPRNWVMKQKKYKVAKIDEGKYVIQQNMSKSTREPVWKTIEGHVFDSEADATINIQWVGDKTKGKQYTPDSSEVKRFIADLMKAEHEPQLAELDRQMTDIFNAASAKDKVLITDTYNMAAQRVRGTTTEIGAKTAIAAEPPKLDISWDADAGNHKWNRREIPRPEDISTVAIGDFLTPENIEQRIKDLAKQPTKDMLQFKSATLFSEEHILSKNAGKEGQQLFRMMHDMANEAQINSSVESMNIMREIEKMKTPTRGAVAKRRIGEALVPVGPETWWFKADTQGLAQAQAAMEGKLPVEQLKPTARRLVEAAQDYFKRDAEYAKGKGLLVRQTYYSPEGVKGYDYIPWASAELEYYWPHYRDLTNENTFKQFVEQEYTRVTHAETNRLRKETPSLSVEDALKQAEEKIKMTQVHDWVNRRRFALQGRLADHLEFARQSDAPGYRKDWDVILSRIKEGEWRKAEIKYFGMKDEHANALIDKIRNKYGDDMGDFAEQTFRRVVGDITEPYIPWLYKLNKYTGTWNVLSLMSMSWLNQLGQFFNISTRTGMINSLHGFGKMFTKEGRKYAAETAASMMPTFEYSLLAQPTAQRYLKSVWAGVFWHWDRLWREAAANATVPYVKKYADNLLQNAGKTGEIAKTRFNTAKRMLEEVGIETDDILKRGYIEPQEMRMASKHIADETQFSGRTYEIPRGWAHPAVRFMFSTFKNFAYQQSRFQYKMTRRMASEMAKGNFTPLKNLLEGVFGAYIAGESIIAAKAAMTGTWDEHEWLWERVEKAMDADTRYQKALKVTNAIVEPIGQASMLGLFWDMSRSAATPYPGLEAAIIAPGPRRIAELGKAFYDLPTDLLKGKEKAAGRKFIGLAPQGTQARKIYKKFVEKEGQGGFGEPLSW